MSDAVMDDHSLGAPTVGTWRPAVGLGTPLRPGLLLGHLVRLGRPAPVFAPTGTGGVVTRVLPAGTWVEHGQELLAMGEGTLAGVAAPAPSAEPDAPPEGVLAVRAETDGTVYLSPEPGAPAFAPAGVAVQANDTLALVEVMKTFGPVRAPAAGTLERVLVQAGDAVSAGQALFWLRPA